MKAVRKTFLVFAAALMVLGTAAPALVHTAYGATTLTCVKVSSNIEFENTPSPDRNTYNTNGVYTFNLKKEGGSWKLGLTTPVSEKSEDITANATISDSKIEYKGVALKKSGGGNWSDPESFSIRISGNSETEKDAFISSSKISKSKDGSATTSVKRSSKAYFTFLLVDPKYPAGASVTDGYSIINTDSFNQESNQNEVIALPAESSIGGKLTLKVLINEAVYTGRGNTMRFTVGYTVAGEEREYTFSQNFPECQTYDFNPTPDKDDGDEENKLDPLLPHIIVSNYDYGAIQVSAGQTFDLRLAFTNTSDRYDLENVIMKVDTGDGFSITNSSNSFYIDSLKVGQSLTKTLGLQAAPAAKAQSYPIKVNFTFQYVANDVRKSGDSSESISIPITQPDRFQVNEIQSPTQLYVGDEYPLSVTFVNKGKTDVYNVSAELRGNVPNAGERQFIGNVSSGTESSADFYVNAMTEGSLSGEVIITYEDENMNVREVSKPFSTEVIAMDWGGGWEDPGLDIPTGPIEPAEPASIWTMKNILLGLSALAMAGLTGYLTVIRIKAKRSEMDDETL